MFQMSILLKAYGNRFYVELQHKLQLNTQNTLQQKHLQAAAGQIVEMMLLFGEKTLKWKCWRLLGSWCLFERSQNLIHENIYI